MAYTVAEAEVTVRPNADNFGTALREKIVPEANRIGRDVGDEIAKGLRERLAEAHPDVNVGADTTKAKAEVDKFLGETKAKAALAGNDAGKSLGNNLAKDAADSAGQGSPLIMAAIAGGLIAGGPLLVAAAGGLFGGLAALILHNQQDVANAASSMVTAVTTEFKQVSQVAVPFLVNALNDVKAGALEMAPAVGKVFEDIQPAVDGVTHGVLDLVRNALPGLAAAIRTSAPVFAGLQTLLAEIGQGLGNFFELVSTHSAAMGTVLSSLGTALDALLTALGSLAVAGSELGADILPTVAGALSALADVLHFLEPVLPSLALAFLAWKSAGIIAPLLGTLAAKLEETGAAAMVATVGLTGAEGAALATGTGFEVAAAGARGLQAAMGPIAWIGLALGALIPLLMGQDDAQKQVTDSADAMTQALQASKGAIDDNVRASAAAQAQSNGLLTWAKSIGVAGSTVVDALLGNKAALDAVTSAAASYEDGQNGAAKADRKAIPAHRENTLALGESAMEHENNARRSKQHKEALDTLAGSVKKEVTNQQVLAAAMQGSADTTQLNKDRLDGLKNAASAADTEIGLLKGALDALTGKTVTLDEAQIAVTNALSAATTAVKGMKGPLVDANGQLDLHSSKGAAAATALIKIRDSSQQLIATMEQQGATSAEVGKATDDMRAQFIASAKQMGFNQTQAETLANRYLGIPKDVKTEIKADTTAADAAIQSVITSLSQLKDKTVHVHTVTTYGDGSQHVTNGPGMTAGAIGGIVHPYAAGGIEPMQGGIAQIVPPQTYRLIGDRITDDEAYIPINDSARSLSILATTASRMGFGLAGAAAGGGKTDARSYLFNISAPSDPRAIAREIRAVQRDLEFLHG